MMDPSPYLLDHAPYTPFMHPRTTSPPGLSPLDMAEWTVRHPDFEAQMARRAELLAECPERVLAQLPEAQEAVPELVAAIRAHLGLERGDATRDCALTELGLLVAEDFCLLLPDPATGEYRLVAAVLCFPSRWLLSEKLGQPLTTIHDPVPDYDDELARRVNRVFTTLRVERPLVRVNWLVHTVPELHLPMGHSDKLIASASPEGPFYLRTERQTLVRLPKSGAVVFGIKTSLTPIERLAPDEAGALRDALSALDPAAMRYRSGRDLIGKAAAALDAIACDGGR